MVAAVKQAVRAGAMGFSSSRAGTHVTPDDTPVASRIAEWRELDALVGAMAELDAGIFQVGPDISSGPRQRAFLERLRELAIATGRPVMFGTISTRQGEAPNSYRYQLDYLDRSVAAGARMFGQTTTKSINAIFALKSYLPFDGLPHWKEIRALPLEEQKRRMADPAVRAQLVADEIAHEAARQRVPGWWRCHHRSAQAGLRQFVRHARRGVERSDRRRTGGGTAAASGGSDAGPHAGERRPGVHPAAGE